MSTLRHKSNFLKINIFLSFNLPETHTFLHEHKKKIFIIIISLEKKKKKLDKGREIENETREIEIYIERDESQTEIIQY